MCGNRWRNSYQLVFNSKYTNSVKQFPSTQWLTFILSEFKYCEKVKIYWLAVLVEMSSYIGVLRLTAQSSTWIKALRNWSIKTMVQSCCQMIKASVGNYTNVFFSILNLTKNIRFQVFSKKKFWITVVQSDCFGPQIEPHPTCWLYPLMNYPVAHCCSWAWVSNGKCNDR